MSMWVSICVWCGEEDGEKQWSSAVLPGDWHPDCERDAIHLLGPDGVARLQEDYRDRLWQEACDAG